MNICNKACNLGNTADFQKSIMPKFKLFHDLQIFNHEIMLMSCFSMIFNHIKICKRFSIYNGFRHALIKKGLLTQEK